METEIKEKDNDFDDMEKHIVCQSILLENYEKKNQILEENYKEMQLEYSGSFDYYKKKIEQLFFSRLLIVGFALLCAPNTISNKKSNKQQ